jgi:ribosomal protein S21
MQVVVVNRNLEEAIRALNKKVGRDGYQKDLKVKAYPKASVRRRVKDRLALKRRRRAERKVWRDRER